MREPSSERLVVVADDERDIADLLTLNLELEGYRVETVYDGGAALEAVRTLQPDFVVLDVMMPVLDGLDVLRTLKADDATRDIPVVALTAHASPRDRDLALAAGCDDFDTKPVEMDRLLGKIETLLAR